MNTATTPIDANQLPEYEDNSHCADLLIQVRKWWCGKPKRPGGQSHLNQKLEYDYQRSLYLWRLENPDPFGLLELHSYFNATMRPFPYAPSGRTREQDTIMRNGYTNRMRLKKKNLSRTEFEAIVRANPIRYNLTDAGVGAWVKSVFSKDRK